MFSKLSLFLCSFLLIMFTYTNAQTINTITVMPDSSVVTNAAETKKGLALQKDTLKNIDALNGADFTVSVSMTNLDRYIKITGFSKNIDFVKFTRDKNKAIITFKAKASGTANLNFQIDDEKNIIAKYIYKINITNSVPKNANTNQALSKTQKENVSNTAVQSELISDPNTLKGASASKSVSQTSLKTENIKPQTQKTETAYPKTAEKETKTLTQNTEIPTEEQRLFNLAEDLRMSLDYTNAINAYKEIITKYPKSSLIAESRLKIAGMYFNEKDYTSALNEYQAVSKDTNASDENKSLALYLSGFTVKQENRQKDAIYYFLESINLYPNTLSSLNASYEYADSMKKQGMLSEGYAILNRALESKTYFEKRADALMLLAEIYEKGNPNIRDYKKSYDTYSKYLSEYTNGNYRLLVHQRMNFIERNFINIK